ncbi:hypothetical protein RFI_08903 [Reticulomyxa filosa]|uniref:Uncharacterized protein n=1 Tax=Reticulomyxa filosa TaxID=46433 RepID=X6NQN2_RETFI|nr:hypothetical protein RFI_08903 [Reticulomyxa filosa]|eukprot:ETO28228.1 hypothetical protein RFI_08903 [Reticulomyxa filosa]
MLMSLEKGALKSLGEDKQEINNGPSVAELRPLDDWKADSQTESLYLQLNDQASDEMSNRQVPPTIALSLSGLVSGESTISDTKKCEDSEENGDIVSHAYKDKPVYDVIGPIMDGTTCQLFAVQCKNGNTVNGDRYVMKAIPVLFLLIFFLLVYFFKKRFFLFKRSEISARQFNTECALLKLCTGIEEIIQFEVHTFFFFFCFTKTETKKMDFFFFFLKNFGCKQKRYRIKDWFEDDHYHYIVTEAGLYDLYC